MKSYHLAPYLCFALLLLTTACVESPTAMNASSEEVRAEHPGGGASLSLHGAMPALEGPFSLSPASFDVAATPDGGLLVGQNNTVMEIRRGEIRQVAELSIPAAVNGLAARGVGNFFATAAGLDLAVGAGVWHVSRGGARLVGDIEAFEIANDPDAFEGPQWKNQACEEDPAQGFSAGPQSNPYHVVVGPGGSAIVGDAAGNTVLEVGTDGHVDWVAVLTPPVDENGDYRFLKTAESDSEIDCFVQPVATSVDIGPDDAFYVGELTGAPGVPGWSRVWRVAPGSMHAVCPSDECEMVVDGMTSIIDLAFGPDDMLYVAEYDENGWLAVVTGGELAGGTVNRCDVLGSGVCEPVAEGLSLPSAITFDKRGNLWLLESNIIAPVVRMLEY